MSRDHALAALALAAAWALCAFGHPAVRRALLDGLRCLGRYPDLWRIPAMFGFGYAVFQLAAAALFHARLQDLAAWLTALTWQPADLPSVPAASLLPAAERTAAVFTIFTATFPLSAVFALLLVGNFRGMLGEMTRALRRRFGRGRGLLLVALLLLTALAAIAKPAVYLLLPEITERTPFIATLSVGLLSSIFELLLGVFFLTYLMFMAYAWLRGLHFHRFKLYRVAMRRTGYVLKWSFLVSALALLLVMLPTDLGLVLAPESEAGAWFTQWIGRPLVTAVALLYGPVQAILVFHNGSLRHALRENARLRRAHWPVLALFLAAAYGPFLFLEGISQYAALRLGEGSSPALVAALAAAWIEAVLAGWLIASWVCLYKNLSTGRKEILF